MGSNDKYIDKLSDRVSQFFNNIFLADTPVHAKSCLENGSDFKQDFTPLLNDSDIKPVLTTIKKHKRTRQWSNCTK